MIKKGYFVPVFMLFSTVVFPQDQGHSSNEQPIVSAPPVPETIFDVDENKNETASRDEESEPPPPECPPLLPNGGPLSYFPSNGTGDSHSSCEWGKAFISSSTSLLENVSKALFCAAPDSAPYKSLEQSTKSYFDNQAKRDEFQKKRQNTLTDPGRNVKVPFLGNSVFKTDGKRVETIGSPENIGDISSRLYSGTLPENVRYFKQLDKCPNPEVLRQYSPNIRVHKLVREGGCGYALSEIVMLSGAWRGSSVWAALPIGSASCRKVSPEDVSFAMVDPQKNAEMAISVAKMFPGGKLPKAPRVRFVEVKDVPVVPAPEVKKKTSSKKSAS